VVDHAYSLRGDISRTRYEITDLVHFRTLVTLRRVRVRVRVGLELRLGLVRVRVMLGLDLGLGLGHRRRNRGGRGGPGPLTFLFEGGQYYRAPPLLKNAAPSLS